MIPIHLSRPIVCLALLVGALAPARGGHPPGVPTLQPYQVSSPDETYLFEVNPSHRYGSGPSSCTLTNRESGEVAWKRDLPFTYWRACVDDSGHVGGFGYSKGPMGGDPWNLAGDGGDFLVRVLDPGGRIIHAETTFRGTMFGGYTAYVPPPFADSLAFDAENDRMVILMHNDTFRSYRLHGDGLLHAVALDRKQFPAHRFGLDEFRAVPRSPLLLLDLPWWETVGERHTAGALFCLLDQRVNVVWSLDRHRKLPEHWDSFEDSRILSLTSLPRPDPFADPGDPFGGADDDPNAEEPDPFAPDEPGEAAEKEGEDAPQKPAPPEPVAEFDLFLEDRGERVTFRVLKQGKEEDGDVKWQVEETKRIVWTIPPENHVPKDIPRLEGRVLAKFQLFAADKGPFVESLGVVALGPNEQIYALEEESNAVHVFDRNGKFLHLCKPAGDTLLETGPHYASLAINRMGEVFVKVSDYLPKDGNKFGVENPLKGHYLHFSPKGVLHDKLLKEIPHQVAVNDIERRPDGLWLDGIEDVAFAPDGSIAVRDSPAGNFDGIGGTPFPLPPSHLPAETINLYNAKGEPVRTIDFTAGKSFDRIAYDGTHLVATRGYDPPHQFVYVLKGTGESLGVIVVDDLADPANANLRAFIVNGGSEILIVDLSSARAYRYAMPK